MKILIIKIHKSINICQAYWSANWYFAKIPKKNYQIQLYLGLEIRHSHFWNHPDLHWSNACIWPHPLCSFYTLQCDLETHFRYDDEKQAVLTRQSCRRDHAAIILKLGSLISMQCNWGRGYLVLMVKNTALTAAPPSALKIFSLNRPWGLFSLEVAMSPPHAINLKPLIGQRR